MKKETRREVITRLFSDCESFTVDGVVQNSELSQGNVRTTLHSMVASNDIKYLPHGRYTFKFNQSEQPRVRRKLDKLELKQHAHNKMFRDIWPKM